MKDNRILTLGSLIGAEGGAQMISGYRLIDDGGVVGVGYICVPYPLGFMDDDSIILVRATDVTQVYFEGHEDPSAQMLAKSLEELAAAKEDADTLSDYYRSIREALAVDEEDE